MTPRTPTTTREKLRAFLESLSNSERDEIAGLDYGADAAKYRQALDQVIAAGGVTRPEEFWFPREVIELGRHGDPSKSERVYTACLSILLLNIALGNDRVHDAWDELEHYLDRGSALGPELSALVAELFELCGIPSEMFP